MNINNHKYLSIFYLITIILYSCVIYFNLSSGNAKIANSGIYTMVFLVGGFLSSFMYYYYVNRLISSSPCNKDYIKDKRMFDIFSISSHIFYGLIFLSFCIFIYKKRKKNKVKFYMEAGYDDFGVNIYADDYDSNEEEEGEEEGEEDENEKGEEEEEETAAKNYIKWLTEIEQKKQRITNEENRKKQEYKNWWDMKYQKF